MSKWFFNRVLAFAILAGPSWADVLEPPPGRFKGVRFLNSDCMAIAAHTSQMKDAGTCYEVGIGYGRYEFQYPGYRSFSIGAPGVALSLGKVWGMAESHVGLFYLPKFGASFRFNEFPTRETGDDPILVNARFSSHGGMGHQLGLGWSRHLMQMDTGLALLLDESGFRREIYDEQTNLELQDLTVRRRQLELQISGTWRDQWSLSLIPWRQETLTARLRQLSFSQYNEANLSLSQRLPIRGELGYRQEHWAFAFEVQEAGPMYLRKGQRLASQPRYRLAGGWQGPLQQMVEVRYQTRSLNDGVMASRANDQRELHGLGVGDIEEMRMLGLTYHFGEGMGQDLSLDVVWADAEVAEKARGYGSYGLQRISLQLHRNI